MSESFPAPHAAPPPPHVAYVVTNATTMDNGSPFYSLVQDLGTG